MQKITPCLWFDTQAEEAANFYVSLFDDAEVTTGGAPGRHAQRRQRGAGVLPARRSGVHGHQRRAAVPVHRSGVVPRELQGPGRGRPLLGPAHRRRRRREPMRMAQGPVRSELADRPRADGRAAERPRTPLARKRRCRPCCRCRRSRSKCWRRRPTPQPDRREGDASHGLQARGAPRARHRRGSRQGVLRRPARLRRRCRRLADGEHPGGPADTAGFGLLDHGGHGDHQVRTRFAPGAAAGRGRHRGRSRGTRRPRRRRQSRPALHRGRARRRQGRPVELMGVLQRPRRQRLGPAGTPRPRRRA